MANFKPSSLSSLFVLMTVSGLLKNCTSYPAEDRVYKEKNPLLSFLLRFPMMEVDEPSKNTVDIQNNDKTFPSSLGMKHKRTELFQDNSNACCPTVVEVIEPLGGKNREGDLVELYQAEGVHQRFYEISCAPDVAEKSCRYVKHHSKCVQQYSYTYALVRDFGTSDINDEEESNSNSSGGWRLDYIKVRSGCSCQVLPRRSPHGSPS